MHLGEIIRLVMILADVMTHKIKMMSIHNMASISPIVSGNLDMTQLLTLFLIPPRLMILWDTLHRIG